MKLPEQLRPLITGALAPLFWGFRLVHRSSRWLERRFTPAGRYTLGFASVAAAIKEASPCST